MENLLGPPLAAASDHDQGGSLSNAVQQRLDTMSSDGERDQFMLGLTTGMTLIRTFGKNNADGAQQLN